MGSVVNAGSGEPMKGVIFTFVAEQNGMMKAGGTTTTAKPIVNKSAVKGKFRAALPENIYWAMVEKIGYNKQEVLITVANGETTSLNIEPEKN